DGGGVDVGSCARAEATGAVPPMPGFRAVGCGAMTDAGRDTEELHADLRDGVRRVCSKFDDAYWRECDEKHEFPWAFYEALAEGGWIGIAIPEEYGGGGQGITEASILLEEIAASGAAMNGCSAIHLTIFGMNPVVKHGSAEMRAKYLPRIVDGSLHVAVGVTEPDAGTDTTSITTTARRVDGGYLVRGRKVWTTKALYAEKVLLLVRTTPQDQVAKRTEGMLVAAESIGIGRAAIRKAVAYAKERVVFGRPIGQNQGIAFPLAECHARLNAAELVVRQASERYDAGLPCAE